jgi:hypothetical protein
VSRIDAAAVFEAAYGTMEQVLGTIDTRPIDVVIFSETGDFTPRRACRMVGSATIDGAIALSRCSRPRRGHDDPPRGMPFPAQALRGRRRRGSRRARRSITRERSRSSVGIGDALISAHRIERLLFDRTDRERNRWGYVMAYEAVRSMIEGEAAAHTRKGSTR